MRLRESHGNYCRSGRVYARCTRGCQGGRAAAGLVTPYFLIAARWCRLSAVCAGGVCRGRVRDSVDWVSRLRRGVEYSPSQVS